MGSQGYIKGAAWRIQPGTDSQRAYIKKLVLTEGRWPKPENGSNQARWDNFLDTHDETYATANKGALSDMIGWLKTQPIRHDPNQHRPAMPASVPAAGTDSSACVTMPGIPQNGAHVVSSHTHQPTQTPGWFPEAGTFYLVDDTIYKVFMGRRPYAKELVLYPHDTDPKKRKGKFEYVQGAIRKIPGPEYALTPQQAVILGHAFGFCAYCGTELDDPNSVQRGVGPHCWKKYHLPALARMKASV